MKNKTVMTPLEFLKSKKNWKMDEYLVSFMSEAVEKHNKQKEGEANHKTK